jgi:NAD(P)-dependent dehydrogenase (short-subunit alcohol dehydrogenase family)
MTGRGARDSPRQPKTALVTGGASGIGRAIVERLERDGADVRVLDLQDGFDVSDPQAWDAVEAVDLACLNAGVVTGERDVSEVRDEQYRRIMGANVDGVVFGVRRLARVQEPGSAIVVTASLAGLTAIESDPIYGGTKHFLVGFVRSVAPQLEKRGIRINAVCPGIVDTPILGEEGRARLGAAGFPLLSPDDVAQAALAAANSAGTGEAWVVQPGRQPEPYRFAGVPGPRVPGAEGKLPPL